MMLEALFSEPCHFQSSGMTLQAGFQP